MKTIRAIPGTVILIAITLPIIYFKSRPYSNPRAIESKTLHIGKSLALALRAFKVENPDDSSATNANEYLAHLVPAIQSEALFYVPNSPWLSGTEPDDLWETTTPPGIALDAGENAFAVHLAGEKDVRLPIFLTVTEQKNQRRLILIYNDGSGEILKIEDHETFEPGSTTVLNRFPDAHWLLPIPPN